MFDWLSHHYKHKLSGSCSENTNRERTVTFDLWISPKQLSTLAACSSSKAGLTGTLTTDLWTKQTVNIQNSSRKIIQILNHQIHQLMESQLNVPPEKSQQCWFDFSEVQNIIKIELVSDHSVVLASLQDVPCECLGSQSQVWQPWPLAMFQASGAQRSQCWPMTFGRQWHWPLLRSQWQSPDDGQLEGLLPSWLQTHSVDKNQTSSGFIKIFSRV